QVVALPARDPHQAGPPDVQTLVVAERQRVLDGPRRHVEDQLVSRDLAADAQAAVLVRREVTLQRLAASDVAEVGERDRARTIRRTALERSALRWSRSGGLRDLRLLLDL